MSDKYLHNLVMKEQIWNYFRWDLDSCFNVVKIKNNFKLKNGNNLFSGGLCFSTALIIFCVIEMMVVYYFGKSDKNASDKEIA